MKQVLKVRNWEKWQTYRSDRGQPPWIKVHRCVMRDLDWIGMTDAQRGHLISIWLLAADRNGEIPDSPELVEKLCFLSSTPDLNFFINNGFLIRDAKATPKRRQHDVPEKNREEKKRTKSSAPVPVDNSDPVDEDEEPAALKILHPLMQEVQGHFKGKFNPYAFVMSRNNKKHQPPEVWIDFFERMLRAREKIDDPWAWGEKVLSVEAGNVQERMSQKRAARMKEDFSSVGDILAMAAKGGNSGTHH